MARRASPDQRTLTETPLRAFVFMNAIAGTPEIAVALQRAGYRQEDHDTGWGLLGAVCRFRSSASDKNAAGAAAEADLAAFLQSARRLVAASLGIRFPAQAARLAAILHKAGPDASAAVVPAFLDALDALESGRAPSTSRGAAAKQRRRPPSRRGDDGEALAALAARGITIEERKRVRALVATAQATSVPAAGDSGPTADELRRVHAWFSAWADVAREVVERKDHRVRLGLVRRAASTARRSASRG